MSASRSLHIRKSNESKFALVVQRPLSFTITSYSQTRISNQIDIILDYNQKKSGGIFRHAMIGVKSFKVDPSRYGYAHFWRKRSRNCTLVVGKPACHGRPLKDYQKKNFINLKTTVSGQLPQPSKTSAKLLRSLPTRT